VLTLGGQPPAARIAEIVAMADPVARNHAITATYHELAVAVRDLIGPPDASWCGFAVWASNTAGQSIGLDRVPGRVDAFLQGSGRYHEVRRVLGPAIEHSEVLAVVDQTCDKVSSDIASGNLTVFSELAPAFAALVGGTAPDGTESSEPELVARAMGIYRRARAETDATARAQLVLLANSVAVLHEQQRLQPAVTGALDAGVGDAAQAVARGRLSAHDERELADHLGGLGREVDRAWETALTEHLMTLQLPGELLHLGHDVPAPAGGPMFPPNLDPLVDADLVGFATTYDHTGGTAVGSGAHDWRDLHQRMNFIFNLFRSRQQQAALFRNPFPAS
jgi:hypothetical protein